MPKARGLYDIADGAIVTYTGGTIEPLNPNPDDINIEDIAHSLSMQCRFTGHVSSFYSVAQHSYHVSELVPEEDRLWGLLHDATEAYLADIARPIKHMPGFGEAYRTAETILEAAVAARFGLALPMPESVKLADMTMLWSEQEDFMPGLNTREDTDIRYPGALTGWEPWLAKENFLMRYAELTDEGFQTKTKVFLKTKTGRDLHKFVS